LAIHDFQRDGGSFCRVTQFLAEKPYSWPPSTKPRIADLTALAAELRSVIGQCHGGSISECRIIETLAPGKLE
jgi:hypothetical protein